MSGANPQAERLTSGSSSEVTAGSSSELTAGSPSELTPGRLQEAGAANHQAFFAASAAAAGGQVQQRYDGTVTCVPGTGVNVAFPQVPSAEASEFADEVVRLARQHLPLNEVGWWLLDESAVPVIGPRLLARGFDWGWRPNWMALDVSRLIEDHPTPAGLEIRPSDKTFEALLAGDLVGRIALHVCEFDAQSIGGIYDTGVEPAARRQGIGTALTVAASRHARELGCHYVLLNATGMGQPVYQRAGFELLGEAGQTWWMSKSRLEGPAPSRAAIEFVEAIGSGDLDSARRALRAEQRDLNARLTCGLSPFGIAALTHQPAAARWLLSVGATLDVVAAWDLGWHDDVASALTRDPGLANRRTGGWELTPLHEAAQRGDIELARIVLAAGADLSAQDAFVGKDPLEWARWHGHTDVADLIASARER